VPTASCSATSICGTFRILAKPTLSMPLLPPGAVMSWQRRSFARPFQQTIRSAPGWVCTFGIVSDVTDV
jgi:hypothetical protein